MATAPSLSVFAIIIFLQSANSFSAVLSPFVNLF